MAKGSGSLGRAAVEPARARRVLAALEAQHPNATTELRYDDAYQLLVATILSAQCTDARVNQVTPALFRRFPNARALASADVPELEGLIKSTGFFRSKARALIGMATEVLERHGGAIPPRMEELVALPGVGRKTANVVLGHALGVPGLAVDRHVLRVANRLGLVESDDPEVVEAKLCQLLAPDRWVVASDTLILHGRRVCQPKPRCDACSARALCPYWRLHWGASRGARPGARRPARSTPSHRR